MEVHVKGKNYASQLSYFFLLFTDVQQLPIEFVFWLNMKSNVSLRHKMIHSGCPCCHDSLQLFKRSNLFEGVRQCFAFCNKSIFSTKNIQTIEL